MPRTSSSCGLVPPDLTVCLCERSLVVLLDQSDRLRQAKRHGVRARAAVIDGELEPAGRMALDEIGDDGLPHFAEAYRPQS